jgi:hypothetical protein
LIYQEDKKGKSLAAFRRLLQSDILPSVGRIGEHLLVVGEEPLQISSAGKEGRTGDSCPNTHIKLHI